MGNPKVVLTLLLLVVMAGCRESDGPLGGTAGRLFVSSDPEGARVFINTSDTGILTPDTVDDVGGLNDILLLLDSAGWQYSANARVIIRGGELATLRAPLSIRCNSPDCSARNSEVHTHGNMTFMSNTFGTLFYTNPNGSGMRWPAGTSDSYIANGIPVIAAKVGGVAVALGMYDGPLLAGRPAPIVTTANGELRIDQRTWITTRETSPGPVTIRGIEMRQQVLVDEAVPDVALIRITYRNITTSPLYQVTDVVGEDLDITYDDVYLGFALDPDIGIANDDWSTYDPALDAVIAYDANFSDSGLTAGGQNAPALVGLRMLSAPAGARIVLNAYHSDTDQTPGAGDWEAGEPNEVRGWGVMSGTTPYQPDDPDQDIGMLVPGPSDVRIVVSAGPYVLRPSEEISIIVAVALARPTSGTFTSPAVVTPGSPHDPERVIMQIAADLRARLVAAATLLPKMSN